jgi:hypothetical protein
MQVTEKIMCDIACTNNYLIWKCTFGPDVATKYLIQGCRFLRSVVNPAQITNLLNMFSQTIFFLRTFALGIYARMIFPLPQKGT